MNQQIVRMADFVEALCRGDFTCSLDAPPDDETKILAQHLTALKDRIASVFCETRPLFEAVRNGRHDVRGNADKFEGGWKEMVGGMNEAIDAIVSPLKTAADYIDWIAMGVIPEKIDQEYKGDFNEIRCNLNNCIDEINGLLEEIHKLTQSAVEGNLEMRGDSNRFSGDYSNIVKGINDTLDAVIHPLQSAADYIDWIAMGVIPEKITDEYRGNFNEIKLNINRCIDAINGLLSEIHRLTACAAEGKLDSRGDADKFSGEYSNIIKGINGLIDGFSSAVKTATAVSMEMELAKKIQTVLLPKKPEISGYEIAASMAPADEVGGDYYDVISTAGYDWIVIGDVSGHGVPAGLVMMMVQTSIHTVLLQNPDMPPSELLSAVNRTIYENILKMDEPKHMTIIVLAAGKDGLFSFSGLHEDILVWRDDTSDVEKIETDGMWIGIQKDISDLLETDTLTLNRNDCMVLFTDGVIEARENGTMFGEQRLMDIIQESHPKTAAILHANITEALKNYQKPDDVTLFIIKRL